jgi:exosortase
MSTAELEQVSTRPVSPNLARRHAWFCILFVLPLSLFWGPLSALASLSIHDERYSHIGLIPLITFGLIYVERKRIFLASHSGSRRGIPAILLGIALSLMTQSGLWPVLSQDGRMSLLVFSILLVWVGGFVLIYGIPAFHAASFPLLFLLLMIPIPSVVLGKMIHGLQAGSAAVTHALFRLGGVPVFREGFRFTLPGVQIEIAEECSGIRSTLALFITGLLAGHIFLQSPSRKVLLALLTIPIAIIKNAIRIVIISSLGVYVDRGFFYGRLHRQGGLLFALIGLAMLVPLLFVLQKSEGETRARPQARDVSDQAASEEVPPL